MIWLQMERYVGKVSLFRLHFWFSSVSVVLQNVTGFHQYNKLDKAHRKYTWLYRLCISRIQLLSLQVFIFFIN